LEADDRKTLARLHVERAIRLEPRPDAAAPAPKKGAKDVLCTRCERVICDAARASLYAGMALKCPSCGEPNRVGKAAAGAP
jgi:phage FluMu protein Com